MTLLFPAARHFAFALLAVAISLQVSVAADDPTTDADIGDVIDGTGGLELAGDNFARAAAAEQRLSQEFITSAQRIGYGDLPVFGGQNSPEGSLVLDDRERVPAFRLPAVYGAFQPWRDTKKGWNDNYGIQFTGHYSTLYQKVDNPLPDSDDTFSSGVLRLTGSWELFDRGGPSSGRLVLMVDHRHAFSDIPPGSPAAANEFGYAGLTGTLYGDIDWRVVNMNWQQSLNDGNAGLIVGRYDPNDFVDVLGYANPWSSFQNLSILVYGGDGMFRYEQDFYSAEAYAGITRRWLERMGRSEG